MIKNLGEKYSPLYFLASLGFGGLAVFFFMGFMHLTPHPDSVMPTFESIQEAFATGGGFMKSVVVVGYIGMVAMLIMHFTLLAWNFREFNGFRKTEAYEALKSSNAHVTLMAIPLTLGMTVNGMLVAAMAMIPGMSNIMQAMMPFALLAYAAVGVLALVIMTNYLKQIITEGFNLEANNGLNQIIAAFAFAMVAVGLAAPAAMAEATWVVMTGLLGSLFFGSASVLMFVVFLVLGVKSIMRHGLNVQNSATMWLPIPILTLWAITILRDRHGMQTLSDVSAGQPLDHPATSVGLMVVLAAFMMTQLTFLGLGHFVMKKNGFYRAFVTGRDVVSPAAFTLVCPGVALSVLGMFFLHVGLIGNGIVTEGSWVFYTYIAVVVAVALFTMWAAFVLFRNQLGKNSNYARQQALEQTTAA